MTLEGKPQRYGTQFDWDSYGELNPSPIANPEDVDERRREIGLDSLAENIERIRAEARNEGERPPADLMTREATMAAWARSVDWRE